MAMNNSLVISHPVKKAISIATSIFISLSMVVGISAVTSSAPASAALTACVAGGSPQNNINVTPSHTSVFYIDSGVNPRIDASYVGYQVANTTGTPLKGYWVSLTNFTGGQVALANPADQYLQLPEIAGNDTETVYFLLKASASTKVAQAHDVKVWNKRPDSAGASNSYGCTFSFKKVAETIKAAANKPISTTVGSIGSIGTTFKVTIEGATGTIGQGNPDVGRILYFTPAAYSSFPTRAFRLEKVTLAVTTENAFNNNTDYRFYNDRLLVTPSSKPDSSASVSFSTGNAITTLDTLVGKRRYKNEYTFRILSRAPSTTISPIAQISSGTQIKHTAIDADGTATINASAATVNATITKQINSTSYSSYPTATVGGIQYNEVPYKVTLTSSTTAVTDEIVDTPPSGAIYKTGSTQLKIGSGTATTIADPETLTSESSLNPRPLHFVGPFTSGSSSNVVLTYTLYIPTTAGTYSNTVYAKIGDQQVVASGGVTIPRLTVTVGGDGKVSGSAESTVSLTPVPITSPATSIATTSATLNGTIDANGATTTGFFEWSTSPTLATVTTTTSSSVTGSDPAVRTASVTGLATGTTYYFRVVAVSASVRYEGEIFSFTTYELASTPTVTTTVPTSITSTGATVNASIDPNLQSITQIDFILSVNADMSSPTTYTVFDLTEDGTLSTTKTTLAGASPTDVSRDITGLNTTTTYYYYAVITYSAGTVSGLPTKKSFRTGSTAQYISFAAIADKPFTDSSFTRSPIATSLKSSDDLTTGLTVSYTSESTDVCTIAETGTVITFVAVGFCVITASQAGNSTYSEAEPVTQSFQIMPSAPTATTQAASNIAIRSATINGDFTTGGGGSTSITFTYGTDSGLSGATTTTASNSPSTSNGSRSMNLTGLSPSTTYYYRISASNGTGSANGSIVSFTTSALLAQTITWTTILGKNYGDTATASASASSGLTTSITSVTTSICTVPGGSISGATVTLLGVGSCVLRASQSGNDTYTAAATVDETFTVSAKPITVTADNKTRNSGASQPTFTFTPSGLVGSDAISSVTFTFESATASFGPSTSAPVLVTNPNGPYTNTPSAAIFGTGSASNYVITYVAGTYTLSALSNQVLTWTTIGTKTYGQSATAAVVSDQGLTPVTVVSLTTSICTVPSSSVSGATVTLVRTGECRLRASQPGSGSVGPANDTVETFTVTTAPLTITASSPTGITAGDSVPTVTASYSGFVNSENSSALSTLPTCVTSYTTSSAAGTTESTSCSGAASINYTITYVSGSFVVGAAAGGPYSVTYDLGGGTGTTPTETSKANGTSFTTAANSGFSRSGFSFAGWSCNGTSYGASATITMGSTNLTCTAQWTANATPSNSGNNSAPAKQIKRVGISSMITTATKPVSAPVQVVSNSNTQPQPISSPRPTPTPGSSAAPKPEPTPSANPTPGSSAAPKPEPSPTTPGSTTAPRPEVTTPAEVKKTTFLGNGISEVKVQGEEITVVAKRGFSGNTIVKVTVEGDEEISQITANVTVLPLPPLNPVAKPVSDERTRITWARSPNAISYEVRQDGRLLCKTSATSCSVTFVVPKAPPLEIISLGRDKTISQPVAAKVAEPPAPVKIVPDVALVINFDTNRFNIDATDRALIEGFARDVVRYGYKEVDISGHTDSRGGVDNNVLSLNRARASRNYLLSLVPDLKVTINGFADVVSVASNNTAVGMAANRRAEFRIVKY
jgi:uncharacterized repeat protein (TIGR02543 family)